MWDLGGKKWDTGTSRAIMRKIIRLGWWGGFRFFLVLSDYPRNLPPLVPPAIYPPLSNCPPAIYPPLVPPRKRGGKKAGRPENQKTGRREDQKTRKPENGRTRKRELLASEGRYVYRIRKIPYTQVSQRGDMSME